MDEQILDAFRFQAAVCRGMGAPLCAGLLDGAVRDLEQAGPVARLVEGFRGDPVSGFLPLRVLGAVHGRVLGGAAPELARFYPTAGGVPEFPAAQDAFLSVVDAQREALIPRLATFPQTNEVRRCGALLGGFLEIARRTRRPLRLLELGSSAGLVLGFDRYRYELGRHRFGDPEAPVVVACEWEGPAPPLDAPLEVARRAGCDLAPIRVWDPDQVARLESYVWADDPERLALLRSAVAVAQQDPPRVARQRALTFLQEQLGRDRAGVATVVFHSSMWAYVPAEEQRGIEDLLERSGAASEAESPLAWLRLESVARRPPSLDLRLWPPRQEVRLAHAHPHGKRIQWLGGEAAAPLSAAR
jgi:hypothetical protein